MSKTYKFIDLLSEIELEKIEENTKFKISDDNNLFRPQIATYKNRELKIGEENIFNCYYLDYLLHADFELLEDEENEIDIQSIEEVKLEDISNIDGLANKRIMDKFNEIIKGLKQINKYKEDI